MVVEKEGAIHGNLIFTVAANAKGVPFFSDPTQIVRSHFQLVDPSRLALIIETSDTTLAYR